MKSISLTQLLFLCCLITGLSFLPSCADRDVSKGGGFPEMMSSKDSSELERKKQLKAMGKFVGIVLEKDSGVLKMSPQQLHSQVAEGV